MKIVNRPIISALEAEHTMQMLTHLSPSHQTHKKVLVHSESLAKTQVPLALTGLLKDAPGQSAPGFRGSCDNSGRRGYNTTLKSYAPIFVVMPLSSK